MDCIHTVEIKHVSRVTHRMMGFRKFPKPVGRPLTHSTLTYEGGKHTNTEIQDELQRSSIKIF